MKASLVLNHEDHIALFYSESLSFMPQWVSLDVDLGEIYIGGQDEERKTFKLDNIDVRIYQRIKSEPQILLVQLDNSEDHNPVESIVVPLMISQKL